MSCTTLDLSKVSASLAGKIAMYMHNIHVARNNQLLLFKNLSFSPDENCDKASKPRPSDPTLGSAPSGPSPLLQLPPEVLLSILSYLSPSQLLSLSHLHSKLNALAFDGSLWQHLHPVRWAQGHKEFYQPLVVWGEEGDGGGGGGGACQDAIVENDVIKELLSVGGKVNANSAKFR